MSHKHHKRHNKSMRRLVGYVRNASMAIVAFGGAWVFLQMLQLFMAALSSGSSSINS